MWLVKNDFPEPDGPKINLLRFVIIPFFMGKCKCQCAATFRDPITILIQAELCEVHFFGEQAKLFIKNVKTFFRREIRLIAGYAAKQRSACR